MAMFGYIKKEEYNKLYSEKEEINIKLHVALSEIKRLEDIVQSKDKEINHLIDKVSILMRVISKFTDGDPTQTTNNQSNGVVNRDTLPGTTASNNKNISTSNIDNNNNNQNKRKTIADIENNIDRHKEVDIGTQTNPITDIKINDKIDKNQYTQNNMNNQSQNQIQNQNNINNINHNSNNGNQNQNKQSNIKIELNQEKNLNEYKENASKATLNIPVHKEIPIPPPKPIINVYLIEETQPDTTDQVGNRVMIKSYLESKLIPVKDHVYNIFTTPPSPSPPKEPLVKEYNICLFIVAVSTRIHAPEYKSIIKQVSSPLYNRFILTSWVYGQGSSPPNGLEQFIDDKLVDETITLIYSGGKIHDVPTTISSINTLNKVITELVSDS